MTEYQSLVHRLADHAATQPDAPALYEKIDGRWDPMTWAEYWTAAR
ncbi:MAG: hypothetical protein AAFV29_14005 [Myxococcota bacterium]